MATQERKMIIDGPRRDNLVDSLVIGDSGARVVVTFSLKGRLVAPGHLTELRTVNAQIDSLQREDGSGESWIISGYYWAKPDKSDSERFEGYFSSRTRKGWLSDKPVAVKR